MEKDTQLSQEKLDFLAYVVCDEGTTLQRLRPIVEEMGITLHELFALAMDHVSSGKCGTTIKITDTKTLLKRLVTLRDQLHKETKESERYDKEKENFFTAFYRVFNLCIPSNIPHTSFDSTRTCGLGVTHEHLPDTEPIHYIAQALKNDKTVWRNKPILACGNDKKCRICRKSYNCFEGIGCIAVCVPCLEKFAGYRCEKTEQRLLKEYQDDVKDVMTLVNTAIENMDVHENHKKRKIREDTDDFLCIVCMNCAPETMVLPCGHAHVCKRCSESLKCNPEWATVCASCQQPISSIENLATGEIEIIS